MRATNSRTDMRDVWSWALSWFRKPPASREKRARQARLVATILASLRGVDAVDGLHARYCDDSRWTLSLARCVFPREWPTIGIHACTAAAYGLRYVELATGRAIDPEAPLPAYVGEWAIW